MVLVTGGRRGIGRAVAERFLAGGWAVAINDLAAPGIEETVASLSANGADVSGHVADVGDEAQVAWMIDDVYARHGRLDALVNNAGTMRFAPFIGCSPDEFAATLRTNLVGAFYCTQRVANRWVSAGTGGCVVMISSVSGHQARPGHGAYGASKAGLEMLAKVAAMELAPLGIRVNCVAAGGPIVTEGVKDHVAEPGFADRIRVQNPMQRPGEPAEVAGAAFFLSSPEATYITGAVLTVDGGASLGRR